MSTTLIVIILICIMFLGVIDILIALNNINKKVVFMGEYHKTLQILFNKIALKENFNDEACYVISESQKMSKILNKGLYCPVLKLSNDLQHNRITNLVYDMGGINGSFLKKDSYFREVHTKTQRQIYNPFTLFSRGIELIMYVVFGYMISKINADFDFNGKTWQGINIVISLLGGIASIWQLVVSFA